MNLWEFWRWQSKTRVLNDKSHTGFTSGYSKLTENINFIKNTFFFVKTSENTKKHANVKRQSKRVGVRTWNSNPNPDNYPEIGLINIRINQSLLHEILKYP